MNGCDVLHGVPFPLGRPLPPTRVPHPPPLRDNLGETMRPSQPFIKEVPTTRLRRILRRREHGRLPDRSLRLLLRKERCSHAATHRHDALEPLLVVLGAP